MKKQVLFTAAAFLAASFLIGSNATTVKAADADDNRIVDGVYIGSVNVGGMTEDEAYEAVQAYVDSLMDTTFTLVGANGSIEATAQEMGISANPEASVEAALQVTRSGNLIERFKETKDLETSNVVLPLVLEVDKQTTAALLYVNRDDLSIEAIDGTLKRESGAFVYVAGSEGYELNEVASVYAINSFLAYDYDGTNTEISLVCETVEPRGTEAELAVITDCLATFTTDYSTSSSARKANVANAASLINGAVIYPGEEYSVAEAISPVTIENGYQMAGAYENGTVVEAPGGGVCQVATTLYNAVIRAELEVSMRYNHSMIVSYVDPSSDAAIAVSSGKDFRFVNNTDYPVYIEASAGGSYLTFSIYGVETRPSNRTVSFESVTISQDDPVLEYNVDASQPVGYLHREQSAHQATVAELYKVVTVDGQVVSRELFNSSTYKASPRIVTVGIAGCTEEGLAMINAAIEQAEATGDDTLVPAAVDAAKALAEGGAPADGGDNGGNPGNGDDAGLPSEPTDPNAGAAN